MQTTVTIDDDLALRIERRCAQRREGFAEAVNAVLRTALNDEEAQLGRRGRRSAPLKTFSLGLPAVSLECTAEALAFGEREDFG